MEAICPLAPAQACGVDDTLAACWLCTLARSVAGPAGGACAGCFCWGGMHPHRKLVQTGSQDQAESGHAQENQAFSIRIEAPQDIRDLVDRFLDLKRYQQVLDLDGVELLRLLELSETQMRGLLATQRIFHTADRSDAAGRLDASRWHSRGGHHHRTGPAHTHCGT